jgi:uncharacterized protein YndB with AHSA1/START domain
MKIIWIILGCAAGVFLIVLIFGLLQPVKHSVTRAVVVRQKPEVVFALLEDAAALPSWSTSVAKCETLPAAQGKPSFRCTLKWGSMQMIITQIERDPPKRLVNSMTREGGPVLGTWTYQIAPEGGGSRVSITEEGELKNPIYRAMSRLRGLDANLNQTLNDLTRKFDGGPPATGR